MLKYLLFICFFILTFSHGNAQKAIGHIKTLDDELIYIYPQIVKSRKKNQDPDTLYHFSMTNEMVEYSNKLGKIKVIKQKEIQELYFDRRWFINLPIVRSGKKKRIHRIIAKNDEYMLTQYYFSGARYLYVFDLQGNWVEGKVLSMEMYNEKLHLQRMRLVKKYFSSCNSLLKKIEENVSNQKLAKKNRYYGDFLDRIDNHHCG